MGQEDTERQTVFPQISIYLGDLRGVIEELAAKQGKKRSLVVREVLVAGLRSLGHLSEEADEVA